MRTRSDASRVSDSVRFTERDDRAVTGSSSTWAARSNAATSSARAALSALEAAVSRSSRARSSD